MSRVESWWRESRFGGDLVAGSRVLVAGCQDSRLFGPRDTGHHSSDGHNEHLAREDTTNSLFFGRPAI